MALMLYRGDDYSWQFRLFGEDHISPIDLTGVTAAAEIRGTVGTIALTCTVTLPNIIDVLLDSADWVELGHTARWDLQLTFADGQVYTLVAGPVTVTDDVTV